jgi:hypothetical protein
MTDGRLIHPLVCKKTSLSTFFRQFLGVLNLKYLRRILRSENGRLTTSPQHPIPAFWSDHTQTPNTKNFRLFRVRAAIFCSARVNSTSGFHMMGSSKAKGFCTPSHHNWPFLSILYDPLPAQLISVLGDEARLAGPRVDQAALSGYHIRHGKVSGQSITADTRAWTERLTSRGPGAGARTGDPPLSLSPRLVRRRPVGRSPCTIEGHLGAMRVARMRPRGRGRSGGADGLCNPVGMLSCGAPRMRSAVSQKCPTHRAVPGTMPDT